MANINDIKQKYSSLDEYLEAKKYLTPKDIEQKLGLSHSTVSKLINTKGFPATRIGRSIFVKAEDFEEFMDTYRTKRVGL